MALVRPRTAALAGAVLAAGLAATADGSALASFEEPVSHARPLVPLDGVFRADVHGSKGTYNGRPQPRTDAVHWYAITTECTVTGCIADAIQLDSADARIAHPVGRHHEMTFTGGVWQGVPFSDSSPCLAKPDSEVALSVWWLLTPHPDGTLDGRRVITEVNSGDGVCAGRGGVHEDPVVLTRIGDVPAHLRVRTEPA